MWESFAKEPTMSISGGSIFNMFNAIGAGGAQMNLADSDYAVPTLEYLTGEFSKFYSEELQRKGLGTWKPQWDCFHETQPVEVMADGSFAIVDFRTLYDMHLKGVSLQVRDTGGWQYVKCVMPKGERDEYILRGSGQGVLCLTPEHRVMAADGTWMDHCEEREAREVTFSQDLAGGTSMDLDLAWTYGLFCADGYAHETSSKTKYINIISVTEEFIDRAEEALAAEFGDVWVRPDYDSDKAGSVRGGVELKSRQHRLQFSPNKGKRGRATGEAAQRAREVMDFFAQFYSNGEKVVPEFVFTLSPRCRRAFLDGYYAGNGHKTTEGRLTCGSILMAYQLWYLYKSDGLNARIYPYPEKNAFDVFFGEGVREAPNQKTIEGGTCYDIGVATGKFCIGGYEVKNCDDFAWEFYTQIRWAHYRTKKSMAEGIAVGVCYYMSGARAEDGTGGGHAINFAVVGNDEDRRLVFLEPQFSAVCQDPVLKLNEHERRSIWFVNI
jgi:hypothetical protein